MTTSYVTGAGGFIGGHLVRRLLSRGDSVLATDVKALDDWEQQQKAAPNFVMFPGADLRFANVAKMQRILEEMQVDHTYALAADMGGMGFIETHKLDCMLSVLISTNTMVSAEQAGVARFFYASSACVYAADKQTKYDLQPLKESDAYPAMPEDGYGWEKLFSERMAGHFEQETGMSMRVARFHNVYGPKGTWRGGREKAPAAICRKVAEAVVSGKFEIDIWGDGRQARSYMFIDDCVEGIIKIMNSDILEPINLGSSEMVSVNELVSVVMDVAGVKQLKRNYLLDKPKGVNGRNSDNTMILDRLGWEPSISLYDGIEQTYAWIFDRVSEEYNA